MACSIYPYIELVASMQKQTSINPKAGICRSSLELVLNLVTLLELLSLLPVLLTGYEETCGILFGALMAVLFILAGLASLRPVFLIILLALGLFSFNPAMSLMVRVAPSLALNLLT